MLGQVAEEALNGIGAEAVVEEKFLSVKVQTANTAAGGHIAIMLSNQVL